ncbi:protein STU1 [Boeremia exigua]|uniref:protein STU1 n=1 Tax=Boeremia exigua TaxID=749465 RepID=UPI001E8DF5C7|nr:protein STU1 [Boeremia exigua]KAH6629447.1 protein STU1 [Boeremia exigua]
MEEQTAALLAALKKPSTNVDKRLELFGSLKSSIKHQRVPESCQPAVLECIRIAVSAQTSAQLVTAGFSTLSHLTKRLVLQNETPALAAAAGSLCPLLLDHLGNAREAHRSAASVLLAELHECWHPDIDEGIHAAINGSNPRARETAMTWVVKMNKAHGLPFKSYVTPLVANLEDADPEVRNVAKTAIVALFQTAPAGAQVNLKKQLAAHGVRKATVTFITAQLDDAALDDDHAEPAPAPAAAPVRERALPTARAKAQPSDAAFADSLAVEQPPPAETVSMEPIHIYTLRELEDMFRDMAPPFEGRESEQNWIGRDKNTLKLRRILKGNAPTEFHAAFMVGVKSLLDGVLKVANSLRTTMSTNGCQFVQELAITIGPAIDPWVEILLQSFIKMCAATKNIAAQNGNVTVDALLSNVSYNNRILQHVQFASQDKNVQPRCFSAGWVKTLIRKHKSHIEHSGALDSFDKILKKGLTDANPKVREAYRSTYWTFSLIWAQRANAMYETLEKREKTGLDRDPNNPNPSSLASSQTSMTSSFSKSIGPSAARTSLKEKIAEQRRAKLAASKGAIDRPSSAAASYETPRSLSTKSLGAGARTTSNTPAASNAPARPPSAMSGESTKSALKSSTGTGSLMSGTVRRPIRRPELNRPKTADPYAARQTKIAPSTITSPERTPAVKSLKKSVGPPTSSAARSRPQTQHSPAASPMRSKSRVDTGRAIGHRKNPSMGSPRASPAASPHKDEDLTMVKPFIRSQSHHDGTAPFRQRNGMDARASIDSNAIDIDEDNFTMVVPNLARPTTQRVQSTPPKHSPFGGRLSVPGPRAAAALSPSALPAQSPQQKSQERAAPEEVEVYEDPVAGDEPLTADQEVDTPVLGELPINERSNERQPSIDSNSDNVMMETSTEEHNRGHHKTTSMGSVMHTENNDANSPETLKNRQLLASAIKKIDGRTVDAGMFRKIQDAIKSGQEIWGTNDEVFGRLLVACLDYFQTPTEELKLTAMKASSCKSQALATIRAMLSLYRKETAKYFSRVLCTILQAKAQHENTSHIAGDMEATANEIVRYGQVSDCLNAVLSLFEDMPASTPTSSPNSKPSSLSTSATNNTRTMTMSLRTLASLVEISGSKSVILTQEQTHRLGKLAVRCMEDQDPDIRKANIDLCVALHERIVGPGGETKAFWEAVAGAGEQQLNLLTYYLAKKQKA